MSLSPAPDWTQFVQLIGSYLGTPSLVAVDEDGNIIVVMKGEYEGDLITVALDAAGRILMIPTDPADIWNNAISIGIGELIASLSAAKRFDKRGNILFLEDFENGLGHALISTAGSGASVELTCAESKHGAFAAKLTGGTDSSRYAALSWIFHQVPAGKVGFEVSFRTDADIQSLDLEMEFYDGAELHQGRLRWNNDNEDYEYVNSAGGVVQLQTGYDLVGTPNLFHVAKLVVDFENDLYQRALIRSTEVDMSAYGLQVSNSAFSPRMMFTVWLYSHSGDNDWAYIDNVVITQNEPDQG